MGESTQQPDLAAVREQIAAEARAVTDVADTLDDSFVELLQQVVQLRGKVITTAVGNSAAVAARMAHLLALGGTPALFLDANQAVHGSIGAISDGDLLLAISKSGGTEEVNTFADQAQRIGAFVVALTGPASSPLEAIADRTFRLPASGSDPEGIALGTSLAQSAWGDALVFALLQLRGVSAGDLAARHPQGTSFR